MHSYQTSDQKPSMYRANAGHRSANDANHWHGAGKNVEILLLSNTVACPRAGRQDFESALTQGPEIPQDERA